MIGNSWQSSGRLMWLFMASCRIVKVVNSCWEKPLETAGRKCHCFKPSPRRNSCRTLVAHSTSQQRNKMKILCKASTLPTLPLSLCPALAWSSCSSEFLLILFIGRTLQSPSQSPWQSQPLLRSQFVSCQPCCCPAPPRPLSLSGGLAAWAAY